MKNFLIGNFLPGYSGAFRYPSRYARAIGNTDPEWLHDRIKERAARRRRRRNRYPVNVEVATALALLFVIGLTSVELPDGSSFEITERQQEIVELQEIAQTMQKVLPPPPPRPPVPVEVPDDELPEDEEINLDATLDLMASVDVPSTPPVEERPSEEEEEPEIFVVVEEIPEMIGGFAKLAREVRYPDLARQAGLQGLVVVKIVVTADGRPEQPEIIKSASSVLDEAAIEAVMKQRFKPGRQRGRPVAVYMSIPVNFRLSGA